MAGASRRLLVLQGHPDRCGGHFCHALAEEYVDGARAAGHHAELIGVADLELPFLRSRDDLERGSPTESIRRVQAAILASDHVVLIHPLWNGGAPALVRAFMEQAFRPSFTFPEAGPGARLSFASAFRERKALAGKSGRVVVTMQMPAFVYRWVFRPHQEASALWLAGVRPVRETVIGQVEAPDGALRHRWLRRLRSYGERGI